MLAGRGYFRVCVGLIGLVALALTGVPVLATEQAAGIDGSYDQAVFASVENLHWIEDPGLHEIPGSSRTIRLDERSRLLLEVEAREYDLLVNGATDDDLEAIVESHGDGWTAYYIFSEVGYVSLDDWDEVDAEQLLQAIRESTDEANDKRANVGIPPIHVTGWLMEPTLDRDLATVFWVTRLESEGAAFLNAAAIRLGRRGFEMVIWAVDAPTYQKNSQELAHLANDVTFSPGHRFVDYEDGDALAGFGIASLVAITAGATASNSKGFLAAVLTVVLAIAKKAWFVVVIAIAGVGAPARRLLRRMGRRPGEPPSAT